MVEGNEENVARGLKRPFQAGNTETADEDAGRRRGEGEGREEGGAAAGGKEDVSDEQSLSKLQKEVTEMAEKLAEYREKGPVAFASLLESSLAQMRSSGVVMDPHLRNTPADEAAEVGGVADEVASSDKEKLAQRTKLLERLASAKESLPIILREMNSCKERLDKAMKARRQRPAKDLPLIPAPDKDVKELFSVPDK